MRKSFKAWSVLFAGILSLTLCGWYLYPLLKAGLYNSINYREPKTIDEKTFSIESKTILETASFEKNVFVPISNDSPRTQATTFVQWNQSDYLSLAEALHSVAWKETLDSWNLSEMFFRMECKDISIGPQFGQINYLKTVKTKDKEAILVRVMEIEPEINQAYTAEIDYYSTQRSWLDISKVKVSAEQALQIAESNGGSKLRQEMGNNCRIYQSISANKDEYSGWIISYSSYDKPELNRDFYIDAETGNYKTLSTGGFFSRFFITVFPP